MRKRNFDRLDFLIWRLIKYSALVSLYYGLAYFLLLPLLTDAPLSQCWEIFALHTSFSIGVMGIPITLYWLFGGDRFRYRRKLLARRQAALKRREPCKLSIDLGIAEIEPQTKSEPPAEFASRMRRFLAPLKPAKIRDGNSNLWQAEGLQYRLQPPKPASFFRRLLRRIQRADTRTVDSHNPNQATLSTNHENLACSREKSKVALTGLNWAD